ncbi:MAG: SAM-dependent methyltransferase, partial [Gammaproteobacteria bacterium]|nr:SAM-dependent methyltransferase [Gammaproteobacteria bacterium]
MSPICAAALTLMPDILPPPDPQAASTSARLTELIREEIASGGGWLDFERYMELALYAPGLGYYSAGSVKLGPHGDFITAPELSAIFGSVIAAQLRGILTELSSPVILELGAGTGSLAKAVLDAFGAGGGAIPDYWILELSADLRERQRECLAAYEGHIRWLDVLPDVGFEGVILANEVADALPVAAFVKREAQLLPLGVGVRDGRLDWADGPASKTLSATVAALEHKLARALPTGYRSELSLRLPAWIAAVTAPLRRGAVLLIDYGLVRREYYHASRSSGTLVCHYRHRAHEDPFFYPGLQDISAWVDFSACADALASTGLSVAGFTTQAQFLMHGGALEILASASGREALLQGQALKTLMLPGEMGERFKLLLATRGLDATLPGRDLRDR